MKIKESELIRASTFNESGIRQLAKWLKLNHEGPLSKVIEALIETGYFPSEKAWGTMPTGFRGTVK